MTAAGILPRRTLRRSALSCRLRLARKSGRKNGGQEQFCGKAHESSEPLQVPGAPYGTSIFRSFDPAAGTSRVRPEVSGLVYFGASFTLGCGGVKLFWPSGREAGGPK